MENLRDILARLMTRPDLEHRARQGPLFERWPELVGDLLARRCRPVSIRKGVLLVQVSDSVWMQELQMQKFQILQRIWALVGEGEVTDVRWTIRGTALRRSAAPRRVPPPLPLTEEERAWVRAVSAQVADPDLQRAVSRVLDKYVRSPRRGTEA